LVKSRQESVDSPKSLLAELVEVAVLALALYLVITFAVQTVHVIGLSMYPTLDNNDYLIATKIDYRFHDPSRGDIIIMRDTYDSSKDFIKRVIALPGDRLLIQHGHVYINGRLLDEPYIRQDEPWTNNADWPTASVIGCIPGQSCTIPPNNYFVMGDNRNASSDSRLFGWIARDRIEARAWIRIWPASSIGFVDHYDGRLEPAAAASPSAAA
jgi:signal peptidase I